MEDSGWKLCDYRARGGGVIILASYTLGCKVERPRGTPIVTDFAFRPLWHFRRAGKWYR